MTRTVLIVDDDTPVREAFRELVELMFADQVAAGTLRVLTATNGAEAVAIAKLQPLTLILMDLAMPLLDGIDAFNQICDDAGAVVPTILNTGYASTGPTRTRVEAARSRGLIDCLAKPVSADQLESIVHIHALAGA
jgi:CheY-like chemotaxis protein